MARTKLKGMGPVLDRLEQAYGKLVAADEPVEAGVMALLAEHAPSLSTERSRESLRASFVSWNEVRVADTWDVVRAIEAPGSKEARAFAKAVLKLLKSVHTRLNRCSFDRALSEPGTDVGALVAKMRGAPPHAQATMLAVLDGGWHPTAEVSKWAQKEGLIPRTTSLAKAAKSLETVVPPADRLRAHYLLTRYCHRDPESPDPLGGTPATKKSKAKKEPAAAAPATAAAPAAAAEPEAKAPAKKAPAKAATKAAKSPAANAPKKPAKAPAKKAVKNSTKKTSKKPAGK